ncbi:hypothetical protein Pfo_001901 [Paulownia fortunei]|nr:hypothetical protein Pfo_001901 [Paulownia fortunei]
MSKRLQASSQMTPLLKIVEDLPHLADTNEDDRDLKDDFASSTPHSASSYSLTSNMAPVMVTNAINLEEQIANSQITKLINKVDNADTSRIMGKQVEAHDEAETSMNSKSYLTYDKPYTQRIDNLRMLVGYQLPKFQQFDGKDNLKQYVTHFIETCNNTGTHEDYQIKQFVRSLKENAFDWYTDLEVNSIDSWDTQRTINMIELTNPCQWKEESVIDYINRWRNLSFNLKIDCQRLRLLRCAFKECIGTFEELATWAHDMELNMVASGVEGPPIQERGKSFFKASNKESMAVNTTPIKLRGNVNDKSGETKDISQEMRQRKLTLKEMQAKKYPFLDSDVFGIFNDLLNVNLIKLPKMKRLEEAGRINDPKYCKYHRLVGHLIRDCFIFKDKVMQLAHPGKITLEKDNAATNLVTIIFGSFDVIMENVRGWNGGRRLDHGNDVSCNITSEQNIFSSDMSVWDWGSYPQ